MGPWISARVASRAIAILSFILTIIDLVICLPDGEIQLVHGTSSRNGRLEVYLNREWVTIFDGGGFDLPEAVVACRQMGFRSGAVAIYHSGVFGRGTSSVRLTDFHCEGGEMSLMDCSYSTCEGPECDMDSDIGISCGDGDEGRYWHTTGFRRWSGFVIMLILIPFCGHAYKQHRVFGHQRATIIPVPRYHHGRVPLTSPLDDTAAASSPESTEGAAFPNSPDTLPPEPGARVFPHGYVSYLHSSSVAPRRPTTAVHPTQAATDCGGTRPSNFTTNQLPPCNTEAGPPVASTPPSFSIPPPDYSEVDGGVSSPRMTNDSFLILDPPPKYEDIVKS